MAKISIIIRTKNEERWIGHCLSMIYKQDFKDFEVILVDNGSTDHTVEIAKRYPIDRLVTIEKFLPGKAINDGIRASTGDYIVCISAHCVPKKIDWLSVFLSNFENDPKLAGVYGRQLPLSFTEDTDKRDLLIVFGQDRRVQYKDYFFHNANSMFRRSAWEEFPFDEQVTNIEDRVWGKAVIEAGYHLAYDPEASVFHHHGLHQGNTPKRARGVVSIIEKVDTDIVFDLPDSLRPENANIAAVMPISSKQGLSRQEEKLLFDAVSELKKSKFLKNIYLFGGTSSLASELGVGFIDREKIESSEDLSLDELLCSSLKLIEEQGNYPESVLYVNYDYVFRPTDVFDLLITEAQYKGHDTIFLGYEDFGHYWIKNEHSDYSQTDSSLKSRSHREPTYRALYGQGCLTSTEILRKGSLVASKKVGILPVTDFRYTLRLKELLTFKELL